MRTAIPFGAGFQTLALPEGASAEVLSSALHALAPEEAEESLVRHAMEHPVGSPGLRELARGRRTATIIISDHTRPVPSRAILPPMLEELRQGSPDMEITLLVATGFHRGSTEAELRAKLGDELYGRERIVVHDCRNSASNVELGVLPSGARLVIDRLAAGTDLLLAEGFIEPHFFAGFSGGRKSVLPGVCDEVTVLGNHCSAFIDSPNARAGRLEGNPLHIDMAAAARMAKLAFIVNVILNGEKRAVRAFAGDPFAAHEAGCEELDRYCRVKPEKPGDIVISSNGGYPLDQNVYQAVKGLSACEAAAADGAVLILCASCCDGAGGEGFYRALRDCRSAGELLARVRRVPQDKTEPDQWEYQILARILSRYRVIFVADPSAEGIIRDMKMGYAPDLESAYRAAVGLKGPSAHTVVIPDGVAVAVG
jgi:nickel-dependent lactate racemase